MQVYSFFLSFFLWLHYFFQHATMSPNKAAFALFDKMRIYRSICFCFLAFRPKKKTLHGFKVIGIRRDISHFNWWKRMEKVRFKERSSVAKVMGTILSLVGAFVVVLYHGPRVIVVSSPPYLKFPQLSPSLSSSNSNWIIGGCLLTIRDIFVSLSFILQVSFPVLNTAYRFFSGFMVNRDRSNENSGLNQENNLWHFPMLNSKKKISKIVLKYLNNYSFEKQKLYSHQLITTAIKNCGLTKNKTWLS